MCDHDPRLPAMQLQNTNQMSIVWSAYGRHHRETLTVTRTTARRRNVASVDVVSLAPLLARPPIPSSRVSGAQCFLPLVRSPLDLWHHLVSPGSSGWVLAGALWLVGRRQRSLFSHISCLFCLCVCVLVLLACLLLMSFGGSLDCSATGAAPRSGHADRAGLVSCGGKADHDGFAWRCSACSRGRLCKRTPANTSRVLERTRPARAASAYATALTRGLRRRSSLSLPPSAEEVSAAPDCLINPPPTLVGQAGKAQLLRKTCPRVPVAGWCLCHSAHHASSTAVAGARSTRSCQSPPARLARNRAWSSSGTVPCASCADVLRSVLRHGPPSIFRAQPLHISRLRRLLGFLTRTIRVSNSRTRVCLFRVGVVDAFRLKGLYCCVTDEIVNFNAVSSFVGSVQHHLQQCLSCCMTCGGLDHLVCSLRIFP